MKTLTHPPTRTNNNTEVREERALLRFLKQTRQGKYADIEESSLGYARIKQEREHIESPTDTYYYSIS